MLPTFTTDEERASVPATATDRLMAIQALASLTCVHKANCTEQHAGIIARLIDAEQWEIIENSVSALDSYKAVEGLEFTCADYESVVDPYEHGAVVDRDTGMWEDTGSYEQACEDAREKAAEKFLAHIREGVARDLYALTPACQAIMRARAALYERSQGLAA